MKNIHAPKGTKDVLPQNSYKWHFVEENARKIMELAGYLECRTPVFEHTELFLRGVGDTTDVVQKEMYTFLDKGNRSITLKPEGTAGVARAFIESGLISQAQPTKCYYLSTPVFRYERPQNGRLREHHQFGIEVFGAKSATIDQEVICIALKLLETLKLKELKLYINSIGCEKCRPQYNEILKNFLESQKDSLCYMCNDRLNKNPLRILDCKDENCKKITAKAPLIIDYLCDECKEHFEELQGLLNAVEVKYEINPFIVRGLDYYTKTVFEIVSENIGSQGTVCGGGRYDNLIEELGGTKMAGIGFGMGIERLLLVMEAENIEIPKPNYLDVYVCTHNNEAKKVSAKLVYELRKNGLKTDNDHCDRGVKAQFKYADKVGAKKVIILGEEELRENTVTIKDMETGEERKVINKIKELLLFL